MQRGADLKKVDAPRSINYSGSTSNFDRGAAANSGNGNPWDAGLTMNSSATSFYSERQAQIDDAQHEKIKKATRKPFDLSRRSSKGLPKENKDQERSQALMDADDLLSEISTPDINHSERSKIMDIVNGRDRQEQEL